MSISKYVKDGIERLSNHQQGAIFQALEQGHTNSICDVDADAWVLTLQTDYAHCMYPGLCVWGTSCNGVDSMDLFGGKSLNNSSTKPWCSVKA